MPPRRRWQSDAALALCVLTGQRDPVEAMLACAAGLLDEAGVTKPPVPLDILASFQDIRAIERVTMTASGRLIVRPGGSIIQVNASESAPRQNFTIAHEIAHTFFPAFQARPQDIEDAETGDYPMDQEEEHLCDIGASALLLPDVWLRPMAAGLNPSFQSLEKIARKFKASQEATARAIARLDLWPFALVFWEPGWRKADRPAAESGQPIPAALRVTRAIAAPSFGQYIPRNKSIPPDSSVYQAYEKKERTSGVDRLTIGANTLELQADSAYYAYNQDGLLRPRVVSFLVPTHQAHELDQAG